MFPLDELQYTGFLAHCNPVYSNGYLFPAEVAIFSIRERDIKQYKTFTVNLSNLTFNHSDFILNQYYSNTKTNIVLSQTTREGLKQTTICIGCITTCFKIWPCTILKGSIVYVYGSQQKDLFKIFFRFLPVVDVLESPCFKNIPELMDCKIILKGHRNFHDQKLLLACSFNKAYGYFRLCKIKISAFEDSEENSSSDSEEECNN
ncbi:hypothetical protein TNIN_121301 [Trichonephila inaurata madagascariensis]|uniref:Uncharacterized protein n=1 Tax=Trichonephila inaurata madagascariensis TaxID=2747483 RepID=A0A8X6WQ29_9ARAC|nr:hypothetical protein TNIN_349961 [Trichonephila inaurata madagascariensis]GFY38502.1 hypothetical protein TNIN_121301 [Trichonephila inaurata madagascariensis]